MDEIRLREEIRAELSKTLFYEKKMIYEGSYGVTVTSGEFYDIFIKPWKNAFKNVFIEIKKIASQVVTVVRLMFTLNQKKAEEIVARQKDRLKKFDAESKEVFDALGGKASASDFYLLMFMANPGAYVGQKLVKGVGDAGSGAIQFAKEIGIGDKSIATATGEEAEEDALIRRRDQDGPITKALRALEQIFLLAHAENQGNLLTESFDPQALTDEIMAGPLGPAIKEQQEGLKEDMKNFVELVNSISAQNAVMSIPMSKITVQDPVAALDEMEKAIKQLALTDAESAEQLSALPQSIRDEATKLANDKKFQESEQKKAGNEDVDMSTTALKVVIGSAFQDSIEEYKQAIAENQELLQATIDQLFPEGVLTKEFVDGIESQVGGFKDSIRLVERVLLKRITS